MEIKKVEIRNLTGAGLKSDAEGVRHVKTLPCLSVVQPLCGCYEIGLGENQLRIVPEGGAFVAPAGIRQDIVHHNGSSGVMKAHWVFMNVFINDFFSLEDVYDLPVMLPPDSAIRVEALISEIRAGQSICGNYAAAYRLVDLLLKQAALKETFVDSSAVHLKRYIEEHYCEKISNEDLAAVAVCSVPNVYRIFQKYFGLSPHNYVNKVRLEKASILLENSPYSISDVACMVGFEDQAYFAKLFKAAYQRSPKKYREEIWRLRE